MNISEMNLIEFLLTVALVSVLLIIFASIPLLITFSGFRSFTHPEYGLVIRGKKAKYTVRPEDLWGIRIMGFMMFVLGAVITFIIVSGILGMAFFYSYFNMIFNGHP